MAKEKQGAAERFMAALQQAEQSRDPSPLVELFHDGAELHTLAKEEVAHGRDGAAKFWADYLAVFESVKSEFTNVVAGEKSAAMEWVAEGVLVGGKSIHYRGVSVLELDGDQVKVFRTYFDTAAFVHTPPATIDAGGM